MKKFSKFLSLFMVMALLISSLSCVAFAADGEEEVTSDAVKFYITSENAKYVTNGVASVVGENNTISDKTGVATRLFYRFDCSPLFGKNVQKVTLKFWANRNFAGKPNFTINKLNEDVWEKADTETLSGTYWGTDSNSKAEKQYINTAGAENFIDNGSYYPIEIDVTTIFNNAGITIDNPYLELMLRSGLYSDTGTKIAGLSNSSNAPYFEVVTKESSYFVDIDEFGSEEVVATMAEAKECDKIVAKTSFEFNSMIPLAAIYNVSDDTLADVVIGEANTSNVIILSDDYEGDKYIKFFLFDNMDNIMPLIPAKTLE